MLSKAYGDLLKVYKQSCPYRIVMSSLGSSLYEITSFLHDILYKSMSRTVSHVKYYFTLFHKLSNLKLANIFTLVSLDVVSLFTNISLDLAMISVRKRWREIKNNTNIPREKFLCAVEFVLNFTYFTFDNSCYR